MRSGHSARGQATINAFNTGVLPRLGGHRLLLHRAQRTTGTQGDAANEATRAVGNVMMAKLQA